MTRRFALPRPLATLPSVSLALFLLGLLFGSFLNVCIHRLPRGRSIITPRSACPHCAHPIRPYDNIPLLSWLLLRGKCRDCRVPISLRYPTVELATALLFLASALHFQAPSEIAKYCCLSALLIVLFFTDLEHQLLPDAVTLPGIVLGLCFSLFVYVPGLPGLMIVFPSHRAVWLLNSSIGAITGAAFLFLIAELYFRARGQQGMGLGDVKLMALIGAFLGFRLALFTILAASVAGSVLGLAALALLYCKRLRRYHSSSPSPWRSVALRGESPRSRAWTSARLMLRHFPIPFGSFLSAAALFAAFFADRLLHWYWNLF